MKQLCVVLAVIVTLASPAFAKRMSGPPGSKVEFEFPTGWTATGSGSKTEGVLVAMSPDQEASIVFAVSEAANLEKAVKVLDAQLGKIVTNVKTEKASKVTINGMPGLAALGTGTIKGSPVKTGVVVLQTKGGKILFVIGVVNAAKSDAYKKTFDEVIASLKPSA